MSPGLEAFTGSGNRREKKTAPERQVPSPLAGLLWAVRQPAPVTALKLPARANFPSEEPVHFLSHPAPPPSSGLLHFLFSFPHSLFSPALPSTKAGSQCTHDKSPSSQGLLRGLRTHSHLFIQRSRRTLGWRGGGWRCMATLEGLAENGLQAPFSKGRN